MTTAKTVALALTVASVLAAALSYGTLLIGAYVASPGVDIRSMRSGAG